MCVSTSDYLKKESKIKLIKWRSGGREGEREGGREGESHSVSKSVGQELPIRETMQGKKKEKKGTLN